MRGVGSQMEKGIHSPWARFSVPSDEGAVNLVRELITAGIPVIEVLPEEGRLERLFFTEHGNENAGK